MFYASFLVQELILCKFRWVLFFTRTEQIANDANSQDATTFQFLLNVRSTSTLAIDYCANVLFIL